MIEITIGMNQSNQRFDKMLRKHLKEAPDGFIYKMLRKKNITLNGQKAIGNEQTVFGDTVQFYLSQETYDKMRGNAVTVNPEELKFPEIPILYEDDDVCIFVKPAGILSQKARPHDTSINEWVVLHARRNGIVSDSDFESFRPSVVNRLDRNTSGIMCAGLSLKGLQELSAAFRDHRLRKFYYALVEGQVTEKQVYRSWLVKDTRTNKVRIYPYELHGAAPIHTEAVPVVLYPDRTLLSVELFTGKSHQIRAQLAAAGHPVLGDPKYGDASFNRKYGLDMQCLAAYRLEFPDDCPLQNLAGKIIETEAPETWPLGTAGASGARPLRK